jgi:hypothetical protein
MLERRLIAPLLALQGFEQCRLEAFFVLGMMTLQGSSGGGDL